MLDGLIKDVNNTGMSDILALYKEYTKEDKDDNKSASTTTTVKQAYTQLDQRTNSVNQVTSPLDNKYFVYGGIALAFIIGLFVVKGK